MFDWDDLRYFLAVARVGKLSRAASLLAINPTTVGRRLSLLEEQMGAKLFDKTPEGYTLTAAGRALLPRAERMQAEADAVARDVVGSDDEHEGMVRVSVTEMIGTRFIAPRLVRFRAHYPKIVIDLNCTAREVNLTRREADIALRLTRPQELGVVTKKLAPIPIALYASTGYLEQHPFKPAEGLEHHAVVMFADTRRFSLENSWLEARLGSARVAMRSDSVSSIYSAVLSGLGIGLLPEAVAEEEPELRRVDVQGAPEARVIWTAVHEDILRSARIRAVLDFLDGIDQPHPPY